MSRETFEKIPEIAKLIEDSGAFYCNKGDWYLCPDELDFGVENYLDGAWMMYQEQQKKIEGVLHQLDALQEKYWSRWKEKADIMDQRASVAYKHSYWTLKGVLQ